MVVIWVLAGLPWLVLPVVGYAGWKWARERIEAQFVPEVPAPPVVSNEVAVARVVADGIAEALRAVTGTGQPVDQGTITEPQDNVYGGIGPQLEQRWEQLLGEVTDADLGPELKWEGVQDGRSGWANG
jgi:uncharacterized protein YbjT (DUF2867 family)